MGWDFYFIDLIAFLFLIGAVGKSAQLGMHT
jgi:NADH:ubiquinone oxidoreductase subunit 5 (subunit L)/multisubunit Na+/H+ antiporter MnhA subunit